MSNLIIKTTELPQELLAIQAIRRSVFQIGQRVAPALDFDGQDKISEQIIAYLDNQPVGTARIRYLDNKTAKIERLAVLSTARGQGIGKKSMEKALEVIAKRDIQEVLIHGQEYIQGLHHQVGFEHEGERLEEAGIRLVKISKILG